VGVAIFGTFMCIPALTYSLRALPEYRYNPTLGSFDLLAAILTAASCSGAWTMRPWTEFSFGGWAAIATV